MYLYIVCLFTIYVDVCLYAKDIFCLQLSGQLELERESREHLADEFQEQRALIDALTGVRTIYQASAIRGWG